MSLLPLIDSKLLNKTASKAASASQFASLVRLANADVNIVPSVAEHVIRVIHAIERPDTSPRLMLELPRRDATKPMALGIRSFDSQTVSLIGRAEIDAASTKEFRIEADMAGAG